MRYVLATTAFLLAAMFLGFFGVVAFKVGCVFYDNYPVDLSELVIDKGLIAFLALVGGSLVLGLGFLIAGIHAMASKPRREQ